MAKGLCKRQFNIGLNMEGHLKRDASSKKH